MIGPGHDLTIEFLTSTISINLLVPEKSFSIDSHTREMSGRQVKVTLGDIADMGKIAC